MPYFISNFLKQNDGVDLVMDVTNKSRVLESLQQNEIDFALVSLLPEDMKINELVLLDNELYLISNSNFIANGTKPLPKKDLESMSLIFREEGSGTRKVMENFFKKHHLNVRKKLELTSNEAVKQAVIAGLGNSIMPLIGIKYELMNKELKIVPTTGFPIQSKWRLIWLKEKKLSPVSKALVDFIKLNKEAVLHKHFSWMDKVRTTL